VEIVNTTRVLLAAALVSLVSAMPLAQAVDPMVGTWKLNAAKSKGVKSGTSKIEAVGQGLKFTVVTIADDGTENQWSFTANPDGKDVPVAGNNPFGDTVNLTRVDANTLRITSKRDGKVTATSTIVIAADGKSRTTTTKGTRPNGQSVDTVSVYEKQ
jgi:hypothetical protein